MIKNIKLLMLACLFLIMAAACSGGLLHEHEENNIISGHYIYGQKKNTFKPCHQKK
jgi:hypothetical protein